MSVEIFEIFDTDERLIGELPREEVHKMGHIHRASHVLVWRSNGNLVLQKRTKMKDVYPGKWDLSTAEHAKPGEAPFETALRGLKEELGISSCCLTQLAGRRLNRLDLPTLKIHDYEFVRTFSTIVDAPLAMDSEEVAQLREIPLKDLAKEMSSAPQSFTPWFIRDYYELVQTTV